MVVDREKEKKGKPTINFIGDSMIKNVTKTVKCEDEGSGCLSLRGAGIKQIMNKGFDSTNGMKKNRRLILQGEGNSLNMLGTEETVKSILEAVKI